MKTLDATTIYTVSTLNNEASALLNQHFGAVWVTGEISNLSRPSSGHLYFSLKDDKAHIRCALFRFQHQQINFQIENGQQVIVQAQVSVYEARGDFQLIISNIQLAGTGKLQIAFEKLKIELEKAGLFNEKNKKELPIFPEQIGVITSPTAAALCDVIKILHKRSAHIPIVIYPTSVQGDNASAQIVNAIKQANLRSECDVLIIARGGGSIEDLWSFNEKIVAQAIFNSKIPIITGIGHQTDFTIADFVADVRAPTPSAAAAMVSPDRAELLDQLSHFYQRLLQLMSTKIKSDQIHLSHLQKRLQHPGEKLKNIAQQLDLLEINLSKIMARLFSTYRQTLSHYAHTLETLSPLKILQRGFSMTREKKSGKLITHCKDIAAGKSIITQLSDGEIESVIV